MLALELPFPKQRHMDASRLYGDSLENAKALTNVHNITLHWVKGHAGHDGNVRADAAAVKGAQTPALMVCIKPKME